MVILSLHCRSGVGGATPRRTAVILLALGAAILPVRAADQKTEMTLSSFRAMVREQAAADTPQANAEQAAEVFLRLLKAQGRQAAARQSLDRLSGWYKAAQARLQAQHAPASDVEQLQFAQTRAAARVAQSEAERRSAAQEANLLLKRPSDSPIVAVLESPAASALKEDQKTGAAAPEIGPDIASRKSAFEKELLPLGNEILGKMYQSYLFGGIPLASLLWQEQEVYSTEVEYRLLVAEGELRPEPAAATAK